MAILLYKWLWAMSAFFSASPSADGAAASGLHPLYVSVTEINHNVTDKTMEVSCKIFTDDFEKGISEVLKKKVDLTKPVDAAEANKLVSEYIRQHVQISADGKALKLEFIGFEQERDVIWSYFQAVDQPAAPKKISVKNNILYETYEGQINMMHVTVGSKRKSFKVSNPEVNAVFEF